MALAESELTETALRLAEIAGVVANFCDHVEHSEVADLETIRRSASRLRALGVATARAAGKAPLGLYAERLAAIERRNVLHHDDSFDGCAAAYRATTWRDLQLCQVQHDRVYHPDVIGLAKADQLRHYALHLAKLAGAAAEVVANRTGHDEFVSRRVPDILLFGIKLSTVVGERLTNDSVIELSSEPVTDHTLAFS